MTTINLRKYSYRFAEQVLNSKLSLKEECESVISVSSIEFNDLSRPRFNSVLKERFERLGWESEPRVFEGINQPLAKMDFIKDRIGVEVGFGHASFLGIDLLKFQVSSYSALDKIDVGIYIVTTKNFQKFMKVNYQQNWEGSLTFEKLMMYLPNFKSAIQVPIFVYGIDL